MKPYRESNGGEVARGRCCRPALQAALPGGSKGQTLPKVCSAQGSGLLFKGRQWSCPAPSASPLPGRGPGFCDGTGVQWGEHQPCRNQGAHTQRADGIMLCEELAGNTTLTKDAGRCLLRSARCSTLPWGSFSLHTLRGETAMAPFIAVRTVRKAR